MNEEIYIKRTVIFLIVLLLLIYIIKKIIDYIDITSNNIDETKYFPKNEREYQIIKILSNNPFVLIVFGIILLIIFSLVLFLFLNWNNLNVPKINIKKPKLNIKLPKIIDNKPIQYNYYNNIHTIIFAVIIILILVFLSINFTIKNIPKKYSNKIKENIKYEKQYNKIENVNRYLYLISLILFFLLILIAIVMCLLRNKDFIEELLKNKYYNIVNNYYASDFRYRY
jgi:hypothetical protein